jgi:hypothetical protein
MATQVTLKYQAEPIGASATKLAFLMGASQVPVPPDILQAAGLRVTFDDTPVATPVVRTIIIKFDPSIAAVAEPTIAEGSVTSITRVGPGGIDYILPPAVSFTNTGTVVLSEPTAQAFLELEAVNIVSNGSGYSAEAFAVVLGQMAPPTYIARPYPGTLNTNVHSTGDIPPSSVQGTNIGIQGRGYSSKARILFDGPLDPSNPNAHQAQAIITQLGPHGEIQAVQITDPGEGYIRVPKITVQEDIPFGIEIARQPDPIFGAVVGPQNLVAPRPGDAGAVTANISPIMGVGTPARVSITIGLGGTIATATVTNKGDQYIGVPQIVIIDPLGTPSETAVLVARMGVSPNFQIINPGRGVDPAAGITLTSFFKTLFPDTSDQRAPFWQLMQTAIAINALSPIGSTPPDLL